MRSLIFSMPLCFFSGEHGGPMGRVLRCVSLLVFVLGLSACGSQVLLRDLGERDANEIVAVLAAGSVDATKLSDPKGKSFSVEVRASEFARAVAILRALGLPREPRPSLNDVFRSTGFAPTPFEEKIRYLYGLAQELERTISLMEGILHTRVHVAIPDSSNRNTAADMQAKASIFLNYDDRYDIEQYIPRIRKLVSDSIEGVQTNRVEVLAMPSRTDLKSLRETPIVSVLGIRIHKADFPILASVIGALVALLLLAAWVSLRPMLRQWLDSRAAALPKQGA